jgi:S1-C subfamily serine protease
MGHRRTLLSLALSAVVAAAVAGGVATTVAHRDVGAGASGVASPGADAEDATADGALTPEQIYAQAAPGVVVITATKTQDVAATLFTPAEQEKVEALGSGFVIDRRGDILTNQHVVAGGSHIRVGFSNGSSYPATVVGSDPSTDIAVVRVNAPASALHPLAFDQSAALRGGDPVYAIGNPFGLDRTMSAGIVSATGRDIQAPNGKTIANAVQTDAAINHGNSGGPLLDDRGRVVGVNAQIESGGTDANVGVGFTIPSDTAQSIGRQLIEHGRAEHGWLGVKLEAIDPNIAAAVPGTPPRGVVIAQVLANGPAAKAGLRAATRQITVDGVTSLVGGDAIVAIDRTRVDGSAQVANAIAARKPGDRVSLRVMRDGVERTVSVTLGYAPAGAS